MAVLQDWSSITLLTLIIIGIITILLILSSLIYHNHITQPIDHIKPMVLIITYLCMILFIISLASNLFNFRVVNSNLDQFTFIIWNNIAILSWNFAQILVYSLLLLRIHHTFSESIYSVSSYIYLFFIFMLIIYILCCVIWVIHWCVYLKIYYNREIKLYTAYTDMNTIYIIVVEIIDAIISIVLITTFIRQMLKVIAALCDDINIPTLEPITLSSSSKSLNSQHRISHTINDNQQLILNCTTKYMILSFIATFFTQLNILGFCFLTIGLDINSSWKWGDDWVPINGILFIIDCIINPICLYLLFAINNKIYKKICKKCHLCVGTCLQRLTQKRIAKKHIHIQSRRNTESEMYLTLFGDQ